MNKELRKKVSEQVKDLDGNYIGPAGQKVHVVWSDGPGRGQGCYMWSVNGAAYGELTDDIKVLISGFKKL